MAGRNHSRCGFLFLVPIALLLACGRDAEMLKETSREANAQLRFANFRHTLYKGSGQLKWDIRGEEAFIYKTGDDVQRIVAYGFAMKQPDAQDPVEIQAKRGELDYEKKTVLMEGDCLLKDRKGSIRSVRLVYDLEKKVASSSDPVSIERSGTRTDCMGGMVFDRASDRMSCRAPRGTVVPTPGSGKKGDEKKTTSPEDLFQ